LVQEGTMIYLEKMMEFDGTMEPVCCCIAVVDGIPPCIVGFSREDFVNILGMSVVGLARLSQFTQPPAYLITRRNRIRIVEGLKQKNCF
jgi:hypothetical protein